LQSLPFKCNLQRYTSREQREIMAGLYKFARIQLTRKLESACFQPLNLKL
jgi:hypothetical protein